MKNKKSFEGYAQNKELVAHTSKHSHATTYRSLRMTYKNTKPKNDLQEHQALYSHAAPLLLKNSLAMVGACIRGLAV